MANNQLKWCFGLRDGLKIAEPNDALSHSYLEQAKSSLLRAEKNLHDHDLLWSTVTMYYAEYYALYSFLQNIGLKSENHACSILAATVLLGGEKTKIIREHKDKRIDAQYYMKIDQEDKVKIMLQEAKAFVSEFDILVSGMAEEEIQTHRGRLP